MISFRFHLVSLVAVFLALGLGVLTGTTVLNRGIVAQLERQTDQLAAQADQLRQNVRRLEAEVAGWSEFGREIRDFVLTGRLRAVDAIMVTQEGADPAAVDGVRQVLERSGARLRLELLVSGRMALADPGDREALAEVAGLPSGTNAGELRPKIVEQLADQLAFGASAGDVVEALAGAGFLAQERPDPLPDGQAVPADALILVVGGGARVPSLAPSDFLVPLVERLVLDGQAVAASEGRNGEVPFVTVVRQNGVAERLVTQDNVDELPGEISLILAVEDLLEEGVPGHYGVKAGASRLMPPLP